MPRRLTKRQRETLSEIATGHVTTVTYDSGPVYMGPVILFRSGDVTALVDSGLVCTREKAALVLTDRGREVLLDV